MKKTARALLVAAVIAGGSLAGAAPAQAHWTGWTHEHCSSEGCWRTCGWLHWGCQSGYTSYYPFHITY
jgi:hypothetical protein